MEPSANGPPPLYHWRGSGARHALIGLVTLFVILGGAGFLAGCAVATLVVAGLGMVAPASRASSRLMVTLLVAAAAAIPFVSLAWTNPIDTPLPHALYLSIQSLLVGWTAAQLKAVRAARDPSREHSTLCRHWLGLALVAQGGWLLLADAVLRLDAGWIAWSAAGLGLAATVAAALKARRGRDWLRRVRAKRDDGYAMEIPELVPEPHGPPVVGAGEVERVIVLRAEDAPYRSIPSGLSTVGSADDAVLTTRWRGGIGASIAGLVALIAMANGAASAEPTSLSMPPDCRGPLTVAPLFEEDAPLAAELAERFRERYGLEVRVVDPGPIANPIEHDDRSRHQLACDGLLSELEPSTSGSRVIVTTRDLYLQSREWSYAFACHDQGNAIVSGARMGSGRALRRRLFAMTARNIASAHGRPRTGSEHSVMRPTVLGVEDLDAIDERVW